MRVISVKALKEYWKTNPTTEQPLKSWFHEVKMANWDTPDGIKQRYPNASILADNRVVFNIKGNQYRLVVKINYNIGIVYVRFIGTHAEYDKIDVVKI